MCRINLKHFIIQNKMEAIITNGLILNKTKQTLTEYCSQRWDNMSIRNNICHRLKDIKYANILGLIIIIKIHIYHLYYMLGNQLLFWIISKYENTLYCLIYASCSPYRQSSSCGPCALWSGGTDRWVEAPLFGHYGWLALGPVS